MHSARRASDKGNSLTLCLVLNSSLNNVSVHQYAIQVLYPMPEVKFFIYFFNYFNKDKYLIKG